MMAILNIPRERDRKGRFVASSKANFSDSERNELSLIFGKALEDQGVWRFLSVPNVTSWEQDRMSAELVVTERWLIQTVSQRGWSIDRARELFNLFASRLVFWFNAQVKDYRGILIDPRAMSLRNGQAATTSMFVAHEAIDSFFSVIKSSYSVHEMSRADLRHLYSGILRPIIQKRVWPLLVSSNPHALYTNRTEAFGCALEGLLEGAIENKLSVEEATRLFNSFADEFARQLEDEIKQYGRVLTWEEYESHNVRQSWDLAAQMVDDFLSKREHPGASPELEDANNIVEEIDRKLGTGSSTQSGTPFWLKAVLVVAGFFILKKMFEK